ncbi:MAG: dihydropteroate synthase [Verrucomicrobiales bacterium]
MDFCWKHRCGTLDLSEVGAIMGVVNVTPDSFSDGGRYLGAAAAVAHSLSLVEAGATIIDLGGESTRPGAGRVSAAEQRRRTIPVIAGLRKQSDVLISIDTTLAEVAEAAIEAGADIVNDVSGLREDPAMVGVCARAGVGVVVMHMQGEPRTMQVAPKYRDVVSEVRSFFATQEAVAVGAGIDPASLVFDPGIGFGKSLDHNLALIRATGGLAPRPGRPVLLGISRKSFIGKVLGSEALADRAWPTVALTALGRENGARLFRVHEVARNVQALRLAEAVLGMKRGEGTEGT